MMKSGMLVISLLFSISTAHAVVSSAPCEPLAWPLDRNLNKKALIGEIKKIPRDELVRMAVGEFTNLKSKKNVDVILLKYLEGTESDPLIAGFYGGIAYLKYGEELKHLAKRWPKNISPKDSISKERVCELYQKTISGDKK